MNNKTMLLAVSKYKEKGKYFASRIKPVSEDDNNYYFIQSEARPITLELRLKKVR